MAVECGTGDPGADRVIGALAERQHGLVARVQLLLLGLGRGAIEHRLRLKRLLPVLPGVYAVGHQALPWLARVQAALLYAGDRASIARRTGAALLGFRGRSSGSIEVACERRVKAQPGLLTLRAPLPPDELTIVEGLVVTRAGRTLLDLAAVLDQGQIERSMNEIERLRLMDRVPLPVLIDRYPNKAGRAKLIGVCARNSKRRYRTRSGLEQLFLDFCDSRGIPRPRTNFDMPANGIDVGFSPLEVDAVWIQQRVIVELDTLSTHGGARAFERDRARDRALAAFGWTVMRVTDEAIQTGPTVLEAQIRRTLGLRATIT